MKGQKLDLANAFKSEIESALLSKRLGRKDLEWSHLERAHILGQFRAFRHLRVTPTDATSEGIRYKYGSSRCIKLGDRVIAYKKNPSSRRSGYSYAEIGTLTVARVENDFAILKKRWRI